MKNYQWIIKSPIYLYLRKHHCPNCEHLVKVVKKSTLVSAGSAEARQLGLDYSMVGGVYQSGEITVIWKEFECPHCNSRITVEEMKAIESHRK